MTDINYIFNRTSKEVTHEQSLQNSIRSGDLISLETSLLIVSPISKLPNGELPIHFAVRENQARAVSLLVKHGANPMEKDFQGLTAFDHAFLQKNYEVLLALIGDKVTEQLSTAIYEQNTPATNNALKNIAKTAQGILSGETKQHSTPLQDAVLAGDYVRLKDLLENDGSIRDIMLPQNLNLLHLAAIGNSSAIVDLLVEHGADLTATDISGRTPAHYAAANANSTILGSLIRAGACLSKRDNDNVSVLAILSRSAHLRDPLNLSKSQAFMFAATIMQTLAMFVIEFSTYREEREFFRNVLTVAMLLASLPEMSHLITDLQKNWKTAIASMGLLTLSITPIIRTPLQLWSTYHIAKTAFNGLRASYNNIRYRTLKASINITINTVNAAGSACRLWEKARRDLNWILLSTTGFDYEGFDQDGYDRKGYNEFGYDKEGYNRQGYTLWGYDKEGYDREGYDRSYYNKEGYHKFFERDRDGYDRAGYDWSGYDSEGYDRWGFDKKGYNQKGYDWSGYDSEGYNESGFNSEGSIRVINKNDLDALNPLNRLNHPKLDPSRVDHALMMINPEFTMKQLQTEGASLYKGLYRQLMLQVHPDKAKDAGVAATLRLNQARETLDNWIDKNK